MKLLTFTHNGATRTGALRGSRIVDLHATDPDVPSEMVALLGGGDATMTRARAAAKSGDDALALADVKLESPIPAPPRILAIGLNYMAHFEEIPEEIRQRQGFKPPKVPIMFNKQNTAAQGPYDPVRLPTESPELDWEGELGVVIGKTCRRVGRERAFDVIAGYTVVNDISVRDWQRAAPTMTMGKSWDTHCPMGPVLATADEFDNPPALNVRVTVDGEEVQNFNSGDMLFGIAAIIEHLSTAFTLVPGDVIATGTSAGVAAFRPGPPWLREGQVVRVAIEGIGHIENVIEKDEGESFIR